MRCSALAAAMLIGGCAAPARVESGNTGATSGPGTEAESTDVGTTVGTSAGTTGEPGEPACDGELPRGGVRGPSPGSGASLELPASPWESVFTDAGVTIGIVMYTEGRIESMIEPVEVSDRYVFSPVFELTAATPGTPVVITVREVPDELLGTCAVGVLLLDDPPAWFETSIAVDDSVRFVLASRCRHLTCDGQCVSGIDEAHCGSCTNACVQSVCFADACAGQDLGAGGNLTADGSHVWWEGPQELNVVDAGGAIEAQPLLGRIADIAGGGGRVVSIEESLESVPVAYVVRERAVLQPPRDIVSYDIANHLVPVEVAFDDSFVALMLHETTIHPPKIVVQAWDDVDMPWTSLDDCIPDVPLYGVDLGVADGAVYLLASQAGYDLATLRRCALDGSTTDIALGVEPKNGPVQLTLDGNDVWALIAGSLLHGQIGEHALTVVDAATGGFAVVDGVVYGGSPDGDALVRIADGSSTVLVADELIRAVVALDGVLYWQAGIREPGKTSDDHQEIRLRPIAELEG